VNEKTKAELIPCYLESELLAGLNEYTCHADELAELSIDAKE